MSSTLIDLPQLVDLALGTPESGAVNFNVLHALLHAVVQLLNVDDVRVELIGTPICKPELLISDTGPKQMTVEEYKLEYRGKESQKVLVEKPAVDVGKLLVVRKISKDKEAIPTESLQTETIPKIEGTPKSITPHGAINETTEIFEEIADKPQDNTVVDMESAINFARRLDDTDKKIIDFEKSLKTLKDTCNKCAYIDDILDKIDFLEKEVQENIPAVRESGQEIGRTTPHPGPQENHDSKRVRSRLDFASRTTSFEAKQVKAIQEELQNLKNELDQVKITVRSGLKNEEVAQVQASHSAIIVTLPSKGKNPPPAPSKKEKKEEDGDACADLSKLLDYKFDLLNNKLLTINDRVLDVEKQVFELLEQFEASSETKDSKPAQITITDLHSELLEIKNLITDTASQCNFLLSERNLMRTELNNLLKSVAEVADSKVDKDDIDELLSEKADYNMLQRKVSVDYFDANKRDLENVMVEIMRKMQEREGEWCKSIDDLKRELELKLNSSEITAVREYLERRLQTLSDRMHALCASRSEPEAAGTKIKMLKNLSCISCNQHVLMRTEEVNKVPKAESLPAHRTLKPFLTYELDNLRKQMKDMPNSRNMHHYEAMLKDKSLIMDEKARRICTRYCGGSHTIITPQTRVEKGRCSRVFGAKGTTAKCICAEPEPPPCTCPDEQEEPKCSCPEEPEVCSCSSEQDPFEKCMSALEKRCTDIDNNRREICKTEMEIRRQKCKDERDRREKCFEERNRREKCKTEMERREKCLPEIQMRDRCAIEMDRRERCKLKLEKYTKCKELGKQDQRHYQSARVSAPRETPRLDPNESRYKKREADEYYVNVKPPLEANTEGGNNLVNISGEERTKIVEKHVSDTFTPLSLENNLTDKNLPENANEIPEEGNKVPPESQTELIEHQDVPERELIQEELKKNEDKHDEEMEATEEPQNPTEQEQEEIVEPE